MRMQNRELTKEDVEFINTKVATGNKSIHLPKDIRYVIYFNRDWGAINTVLLEEHCARLRCHNVSTRDTLIILADKLAAKNCMVTMSHFIIGKSSGKIVKKTLNFQENIMEEWIRC